MEQKEDLESEPQAEDAGPLPLKAPLDGDVIIASVEALPKKAAASNPWSSVSGDLENDSNNIPWNQLSLLGKIWRITWASLRVFFVFVFLYFFIVALDLLGSAFQMIGGRTAGSVLSSSTLFNNMISAMIIGVLVTVLLQSSSTTTSIIVTMVGANMLTVQQAIPVIMGSNIGTSVTSTIVSLSQSTDKDTFRRSFAGATVHDMFNWLTVLILLPIEAATHLLYNITKGMVTNINANPDATEPQFLNVITDPMSDLIIKIDKSVVLAIGMDTDRQKFPMAQYYCTEVDNKFIETFPPGADNTTFIEIIENKQFTFDINQTSDASNETIFTWKEVNNSASTICRNLYTGCGTQYGTLTEGVGGGLLLVFSLAMMIGCLLLMVKVLNSLIRGPAARITQRVLNANFPGKLGWLTGYFRIIVGAIITLLVQSSSVFTSTMTPLVGLGIVTVEQVYPLTLGSNIGTTFTSLLAAFTADSSSIQNAVQVSLCHLFFNIFGILMFYPIPILRRLPIRAAKFLGNTTADYKWFAIAYLIVMFLIMPFTIFGLSLISIYAVIGVLVPLFLIVLTVVIINVMQSKCPNKLPEVLRSWDFLPLPLRSLEPYDAGITLCCRQKCCQKCCKKCNSAIHNQDDVQNDILYILTEDVLKPDSEYHIPQKVLITDFALSRYELSADKDACSDNLKLQGKTPLVSNSDEIHDNQGFSIETNTDHTDETKL